MKDLVFIVLSCLFLVGCQQKKDYVKQVTTKLECLDKNPIGIYSFVIIIPEEGCSGCISEAEDFYMVNKNREDIFFIFTNIRSAKSLGLRMGKDIKDRENVFLDTKDDFLSLDINENIYPIVFYVQNKDSINYRFLEPGKDLQILE